MSLLKGTMPMLDGRLPGSGLVLTETSSGRGHVGHVGAHAC